MDIFTIVFVLGMVFAGLLLTLMYRRDLHSNLWTRRDTHIHAHRPRTRRKP